MGRPRVVRTHGEQATHDDRANSTAEDRARHADCMRKWRASAANRDAERSRDVKRKRQRRANATEEDRARHAECMRQWRASASNQGVKRSCDVEQMRQQWADSADSEDELQREACKLKRQRQAYAAAERCSTFAVPRALV
ncbi:hypothetical protein MTO96_042694 [Rhipicephalus appendiculatus]